MSNKKMTSLESLVLGFTVISGLIHGYSSQICNITVPARSLDGTIRQEVQLGCCPGFFIAKYKGKNYCKAKCDKPCINAKCIAPNLCSCKPGYEFESEYTKTNCVPKCDNCTNGSCVQPNVCQCRLKFHKNADGVCVPNCSSPCVNGTCVAPNVCQCREGYQLNDTARNVCEPACEKPCQNGFCSGVNQCSCLEGFTKEEVDPFKCLSRICINGVVGEESDCECPADHLRNVTEDGLSRITECITQEIETCDPECFDTLCLRNTSCKCDIHHKMVLYDEFFQCVPMAKEECDNDIFEDCPCPSGWKVNENDPEVCIPICDLKCGFGFCSAPNTCCGHKGNQFDCEAVCGNCSKNEECVNPGQCQCKEKFRMTATGDCEEIICNLGTIVGEKCVCVEGYLLDETNTCRGIKEQQETITVKILPKEEFISTTMENKLEDLDETTTSEDLENEVESSEEEKDLISIPDSDMEIIPTTPKAICLNGIVINGDCKCLNDDIKLMDNECVPRGTIEYQVTMTVPKKCPGTCYTGECHPNGTCQCSPHFKLSPEDESMCVPKSVCELCFDDDTFPCPTHCFSTEYSPSVQSNVPQYLIIVLAFFIILAIVVLVFAFYRRMQKHDYYTGPATNSAPIYAYELETLT